MRNDRSKGKKKNMLCNSICKKMGFACNLTVRELKQEQNTFASGSEQNAFSLVQKHNFSVKSFLFQFQNSDRLQCYSFHCYKLSRYQSNSKIQRCTTTIGILLASRLVLQVLRFDPGRPSVFPQKMICFSSAKCKAALLGKGWGRKEILAHRFSLHFISPYVFLFVKSMCMC